MMISYGQLKKNAMETKAELFERGEFDPGKQKTRKKPRTQEKYELLFERALARAKSYKPCYSEDGRLVLPYFYA